MKTLSIQDMEQLISLAGIQVRPCKKTLNFYSKRYPEVTGFELRDDGELIGTYCHIENEFRVIYPRGGEHTHTTFFAQDLSYGMVLQHAANRAVNKLAEALRF